MFLAFRSMPPFQQYLSLQSDYIFGVLYQPQNKLKKLVKMQEHMVNLILNDFQTMIPDFLIDNQITIPQDFILAKFRPINYEGLLANFISWYEKLKGEYGMVTSEGILILNQPKCYLRRLQYSGQNWVPSSTSVPLAHTSVPPHFVRANSWWGPCQGHSRPDCSN